MCKSVNYQTTPVVTDPIVATSWYRQQQLLQNYRSAKRSADILRDTIRARESALALVPRHVKSAQVDIARKLAADALLCAQHDWHKAKIDQDHYYQQLALWFPESA